MDEVVERIAVVVRNKYRNDPAKLVAFESAHRLERAPRTKRNGNTPQTPPAGQ